MAHGTLDPPPTLAPSGRLPDCPSSTVATCTRADAPQPRTRARFEEGGQDRHVGEQYKLETVVTEPTGALRLDVSVQDEISFFFFVTLFQDQVPFH